MECRLAFLIVLVVLFDDLRYNKATFKKRGDEDESTCVLFNV